MELWNFGEIHTKRPHCVQWRVDDDFLLGSKRWSHDLRIWNHAGLDISSLHWETCGARQHPRCDLAGISFLTSKTAPILHLSWAPEGYFEPRSRPGPGNGLSSAPSWIRNISLIPSFAVNRQACGNFYALRACISLRVIYTMP